MHLSLYGEQSKCRTKVIIPAKNKNLNIKNGDYCILNKILDAESLAELQKKHKVYTIVLVKKLDFGILANFELELEE